MFGRKKFSYRTPYIEIEGDIPFNPKRGLLGFSPEISLKVNTYINLFSISFYFYIM
jgi:hypothetical protein